MSLITFQADLTRLTLAMERVADALDRAIPIIAHPSPEKPLEKDAIQYPTEEELWEIEQQETLKRQKGWIPLDES